MNKTDYFFKWTENVVDHEFSSWEELPDIDLYMDQVKTYMNKQLSLFKRSPDDKLLTSSMVNNYVKNEMISAPTKKKYNREHISSLIMICMLKQVLTIPDIAAVIDELKTDDRQTLHDEFCMRTKDAFKEVCGRIENGASHEELFDLALTLSIEANARKTVAEHLIRSIADVRYD